IASLTGSAIECFDYFLSGTAAALVFNKIFFPMVDPVIGLILSWLSFSLTFFIRPIGGVIFAHIGDRIGRKKTLVLTLSLMGSATVAIGLLPTYEMVGLWAPALLITLRIIQGMGIGGEWGGAALLSVENAPQGKKAFYSSGVQVGYGVGLLLSTGLVSLISSLTSDQQFLSWGWRLPFLFSVVLVLIALWIRNGMAESQEFEAQQSQDNAPQMKKRLPVVEALLRHPGAFLLIIALRLCELLTMYIVTAFALNYS
ncbi:MFS transporter, partial [Klebsiella pneumoniae]